MTSEMFHRDYGFKHIKKYQRIDTLDTSTCTYTLERKHCAASGQNLDRVPFKMLAEEQV